MSEPPTVGVVLTEEEADYVSFACNLYRSHADGIELYVNPQTAARAANAIQAILTRHAEAQAGEWVAVRRATPEGGA